MTALEGIVLDVDYVSIENRSVIRLTFKHKKGVLELLDKKFKPYFYLLPHSNSTSAEEIAALELYADSGERMVISAEEKSLSLRGKKVKVLVVYADNAKDVPKLKERLSEFGDCYEYDIPFWKRYIIDRGFSPVSGVKIEVSDGDGKSIDKIESKSVEGIGLSHICFDIETYNPNNISNPEKDPVLMLSYSNDNARCVLATKNINKDFITKVKNEKELVEKFTEFVRKEDFDVIVGYNSSNFDIPYLLKRSSRVRADFGIDRYGEGARVQHHGLIDATKIPGRINVDVYNVARFVSIVGTAEYLIKVNRLTLGEVYKSITGSAKKGIEKGAIYKIWDAGGEELDELAEYSLADSLALNELYNFFIPLEIALAKFCGTTLGEATVSTTGQLVEYLLMRYARINKEIVPNKPSGADVDLRLANPFEGAYVKTPSAGIYEKLAILDFRSLYPSIIIAYNIDPSTIADKDEEGYDSPSGVRFRKAPLGIMPTVLKLLLSEREGVKKKYKKNPDDKALGANSQALKILANSFYGYLGYARSRWYSRECASSVTALAREYIKKTIESAEHSGFDVLYADTDSLVMIMKEKTEDEVMAFVKQVNSTLPLSMELELEDFYVRGVFVGKRGGGAGAKKKYALLSKSGRIKIRGFELVRRDWSNAARETQRKVLEMILREGDKEKAISIVREKIMELKEGKTDLKELVIHTQLRKSIDSYDATSPELAAARKAVKLGKERSEVEGVTIGYVITKHGNSISEKAQLEEYAKDYDADYYIYHQVLPATLKILKELGTSEDELTGSGTQKKLL